MNRERGRERVSASEKRERECASEKGGEWERERAIFWQYKRNCACPLSKKTPLCSELLVISAWLGSDECYKKKNNACEKQLLVRKIVSNVSVFKFSSGAPKPSTASPNFDPS